MQIFLFTDIEGSTRLWEQHGDHMATALARHDEILDIAVDRAGGSVLKTTGDGVIAVFDTMFAGVTAALDGQQTLDQEPWGPTGPLRVRMGIHSGETESRDGDYFGPAMNRAARIMAAGHGGQVLVSGTAAANAQLPIGASLRDLGMHRLKDLTEPEHLYQLLHEALGSDFPPPRTLDGRPHNLPQQATEFLGREDELRAIHLMLDTANTRLLTITGPGGAGKTRLSLQVAAEELERFPDGVFFIDLSAERDPDAVFDAIANSLGVSLTGSGDALETLGIELQESRMLLVLDNFEQVTEAAVGLSQLLQRAPGLQVLVTSRETLRVRAEKVFPVPPLSLPHPRDPATVIAETESVRLFADRARAVRPDFALTDDNAATIAEICLRLDGLPLAIELAAARLNVFSPADLLERLRERLDVLGAGGRDLPDRQRTLWGAIGWSYELLDASEREVFEMLSAFSNTDLNSIEAVSGEGLQDQSAVDTLSSLVDKSLVRAVDTGSTQRFSMLLMIKEFAADKLAESPDRAESVHLAHATHYADLVDRMRELLHGPDRRQALSELETDLGNLRTAWRYWVERGDANQVLRMIEGMWALHESKGWYGSAIDLADEAIAVMDRADPTPDLAAERLAVQTSLARATMALRGYGPEAEDAFGKALDLAGKEGATARQFPVLRALATYFTGTGRFAKGAEIGQQLIELGEAGDEPMLVEGHYVYGAGMAFSGDLEEGVRHLEKAIELHDPARHDVGRFRLGPNTGVVARTAQGLIQYQCGALERGISRVEEALEVARAIGHPYSIAYGLHHNALLAVYRHRFEEAVQHTQELAVVSDQNDYPVWRTLASVFEGVATSFLGDPETGLTMTERGIELYHGLTAPPVFWPQLLGFRAMVHGAAGRPDRGLELINEALEILGEDVVNAAEFRIVSGDLKRMLGDADEADKSFLAAALGASQGTLNLIELQALNSLVQLRRDLGMTPDGSEDLAAVYGRFTEGFEEHDLVAARELLQKS